MSVNGHTDDSTNVMRAIEDERRSKFKNAGKTNDELRRKRVEENVELRKVKREDTLMKRRNIEDSLISSPESPPREIPEASPEVEVANCTKGLYGERKPQVFNNLQRLRKMLSREANPPIDVVLQAGLLPRLIQLLTSDDEEIQFEAAWALTNIASGTNEHTDAVVKAGAVEIFMELFRTSPSMTVAEQALWGLGNIAGDGPQMRDYLLGLGIADVIITNLQRPGLPESYVKNTSWMISNLTRGRAPAPNYSIVKRFFPILSKLLDTESVDTVTDALWSLSYLSDGPNEQVQDAINAGIVPKVVGLLKRSTDSRMTTPSVRVIGNIVTGTDEQTDVVLRAGAMDAIMRTLSSPKSNLIKEACWLVSNVAAGTVNQILAVINSGAMPIIRSVMLHGEYRCQKEASWVIANIMMGGTGVMQLFLIENNYLQPFFNMLKSNETKYVLMLLDALQCMLTVATRENFDEKLKYEIEECGGLDVLESLQNHENVDVYTKAHDMIEKYFGDEDDEEETPDTGAEGDAKYAF